MSVNNVFERLSIATKLRVNDVTTSSRKMEALPRDLARPKKMKSVQRLEDQRTKEKPYLSSKSKNTPINSNIESLPRSVYPSSSSPVHVPEHETYLHNIGLNEQLPTNPSHRSSTERNRHQHARIKSNTPKSVSNKKVVNSPIKELKDNLNASISINSLGNYQKSHGDHQRKSANLCYRELLQILLNRVEMSAFLNVLELKGAMLDKATVTAQKQQNEILTQTDSVDGNVTLEAALNSSPVLNEIFDRFTEKQVEFYNTINVASKHCNDLLTTLKTRDYQSRIVEVLGAIVKIPEEFRTATLTETDERRTLLCTSRRDFTHMDQQVEFQKTMQLLQVAPESLLEECLWSPKDNSSAPSEDNPSWNIEDEIPFLDFTNLSDCGFQVSDILRKSETIVEQDEVQQQDNDSEFSTARETQKMRSNETMTEDMDFNVMHDELQKSLISVRTSSEHISAPDIKESIGRVSSDLIEILKRIKETTTSNKSACMVRETTELVPRTSKSTSDITISPMPDVGTRKRGSAIAISSSNYITVSNSSTYSIDSTTKREDKLVPFVDKPMCALKLSRYASHKSGKGSKKKNNSRSMKKAKIYEISSSVNKNTKLMVLSRSLSVADVMYICKEFDTVTKPKTRSCNQVHLPNIVSIHSSSGIPLSEPSSCSRLCQSDLSADNLIPAKYHTVECNTEDFDLEKATQCSETSTQSGVTQICSTSDIGIQNEVEFVMDALPVDVEDRMSSTNMPHGLSDSAHSFISRSDYLSIENDVRSKHELEESKEIKELFKNNTNSKVAESPQSHLVQSVMARLQSTFMRDFGVNLRPSTSSNTEADGLGRAEEAFLKITCVKCISAESILIKWKCESKKAVQGFEIYVNNELKSKVYSAVRTSAVIDFLQCNTTFFIRVYALSEKGRLLPSAKTTFKIA